MPELCFSAHFLKIGMSNFRKRIKGWTFFISAELIDRLDTQIIVIIVRKHWRSKVFIIWDQAQTPPPTTTFIVKGAAVKLSPWRSDLIITVLSYIIVLKRL